MLKHKRVARIFLRWVVATLLISVLTFSQTVHASASAIDTVANFETVVKVSHAAPNAALSFEMIKPDQSTEILSGKSDDAGEAVITVPGTSTLLAGIYRVRDTGGSAAGSFEVFPGAMSPEKSTLATSKASAEANGVDGIRVNVRITDRFGNPLVYHDVALTSDRSDDTIFAKNSETDERGEASFFVTSRAAGRSFFTATDESSGETLLVRPAASFLPSSSIKAFGGDPAPLLLAQAASTAARFEIINIPATVNMNENVSFTVRAVDANGGVVPNYGGTIIFSSTDTNAHFPATFTFQPSNQGSKTFDLALSFATEGSMKLSVQEQGNALIMGEKYVTVVRTGSGSSSGQVIITKPATGTYRANTLDVQGESSPSSNVKIFDNGQQIAEVQANSAGRFTHRTALLKDGEHMFTAQSGGMTSSPVKVMIDSTPAEVEAVEIADRELPPGGTTSLIVRSDRDLASVQATLDDTVAELEEDPQNPGLYRGILTAPASDGEYTINVIVTDKLGNESPLKEIGKVRVDSSLRSGGGGASGFDVPTKVQRVQAYPGNGRVTLTWQTAQAAAGVSHYRVYYDTDPTQLNQVANTKDAATQWYVPNLQNGTVYYFQIAAVDKNGTESDNWSDVVNATPSASARDGFLYTGRTGGGSSTGGTGQGGLLYGQGDSGLDGTVGGGDTLGDGGYPVLCDPGPCPPDAGYPPYTPEDGPEVLRMLVAALLGAGGWKILKKSPGRPE